jgi:hypothetical protein
MVRNLIAMTGILCCINVAVNAQNNIHIDLVHPNIQHATSGTLQLLAPDASTKDYGFFCRQELKGDKMLPVPLRFRLGSMQQTDWLEQKPNAVAPAR